MKLENHTPEKPDIEYNPFDRRLLLEKRKQHNQIDHIYW